MKVVLRSSYENVALKSENVFIPPGCCDSLVTALRSMHCLKEKYHCRCIQSQSYVAGDLVLITQDSGTTSMKYMF